MIKWLKEWWADIKAWWDQEPSATPLVAPPEVVREDIVPEPIAVVPKKPVKKLGKKK
jgi:hypothetical protein